MDLSPPPVRALFTPFPGVDLSPSAASAGLRSRLLCPRHPHSHSCSSQARWLQGGGGGGDHDDLGQGQDACQLLYHFK